MSSSGLVLFWFIVPKFGATEDVIVRTLLRIGRLLFGPTGIDS